MDHNRQIFDTAVAFLRDSLPSVQGVWVFGSFARSEERRSSDLDLAVLCEAPVENLTLIDTASALSSRIDRDVDLVDLGRASTVLCAQVVSTGRRLWTRSARVAEEFEMLAYARYAALNEERAGILEDIAMRGTVRVR